jgi:hypothetical protein
MGALTTVGGSIVVILIAIGAFFVLVFLLRWILGINIIIDLLTSIDKQLRSSSAPSKEWKCPKCQYVNPNTVFRCANYGYDLGQ